MGSQVHACTKVLIPEVSAGLRWVRPTYEKSATKGNWLWDIHKVTSYGIDVG